MHITAIADTPFWEISYRIAGPGGRVEVARLPLLQGTVDVLPPAIDALLACSDLQGRGYASDAIDPPLLLGEALADDLALLAENGEIPNLQRIGVLLLGDLYANPTLSSRGEHGDVRPVWQAFAGQYRWVVGVAGNHDEIDTPPVPETVTAHLLDGDVITVDGLRIGGVSGIIGAAKQGRTWRRDEGQFVCRLREVLRAAPDILLLHQGPDADGEDCHGHTAIRAVIDSARAPLTLCGHVHWPDPLAVLSQGGQVLNVDARAVLLTG